MKGKIEQLRGKVQAIRSQFGVSNSSKSLSSPNVVRSSNRRVEFSNEERETWKNSVSDERNGVKLAWGVSGGETTTTAISPRMLDTLANGRKERHQF